MRKRQYEYQFSEIHSNNQPKIRFFLNKINETDNHTIYNKDKQECYNICYFKDFLKAATELFKITNNCVNEMKVYLPRYNTKDIKYIIKELLNKRKQYSQSIKATYNADKINKLRIINKFFDNYIAFRQKFQFKEKDNKTNEFVYNTFLTDFLSSCYFGQLKYINDFCCKNDIKDKLSDYSSFSIDKKQLDDICKKFNTILKNTNEKITNIKNKRRKSFSYKKIIEEQPLNNTHLLNKSQIIVK